MLNYGNMLGVRVKKGQEIEIKIEKMKYPNVGIGTFEGESVRIKGALTGQTLKARISKKRSNKIEARPLEVIERSDREKASFCEHFGSCGGCMLQTLDYEGQLSIKREMVKHLFDDAGLDIKIDKIIGSPEIFEYRNKMEFSFGDEFKDGPLTLGMHKKGHHHDVVNIPHCHLVDEDYRTLLNGILAYATENKLIKYNKRSNEGFLRHLVVRKAKGTGEIMVALSATTGPQDAEGNPFDEMLFLKMIQSLPLKGSLKSVLYVQNDGLSDVVAGDIKILYGDDFITEKLFDLTFKITLYSFFQTNTLGAEILYQTAMDLIDDLSDKVCFDLFSGTGTIGQIMAQKASQVIGIEWVQDAVDAAEENAELNGLTNCNFICGDVFEKLQTVAEKPDVIVVDPPRSGMGEKTTTAIAGYNIPSIVYVSCNPSTLLDDLIVFRKLGYETNEITLVDMFPWTGGVECVTQLKKIK